MKNCMEIGTKTVQIGQCKGILSLLNYKLDMAKIMKIVIHDFFALNSNISPNMGFYMLKCHLRWSGMKNYIEIVKKKPTDWTILRDFKPSELFLFLPLLTCTTEGFKSLKIVQSGRS